MVEHFFEVPSITWISKIDELSQDLEVVAPFGRYLQMNYKRRMFGLENI